MLTNRHNGATKRVASGTVTVSVTRTRKASNASAKRKPRELSVSEMREAVYKLTLEWVSQRDIADALHITQGRVSQLLNDETKLRTEQWQQTADEWRTREVERIDQFITHWTKKARKNPRAADVLRTWCERKDKILGLYVSKHELSGPNGGALRVAPVPYDLSLLTDDELATFEALAMKASRAPAPLALEGPAP